MIGLCGAQRVGKSTLAQAFAQAHNIPFVATSAVEVFARLGLDPKADLPIEIRFMVQEFILQQFEAQYREARKRARMFIADRTPIDLASYMLADVQRTTFAASPASAEAINDYVNRCLMSAAEHFSVLVLVQPGIKTVEADGKAPACPAHMEHINTLQLGLINDSRNIVPGFKLPRAMTDLNTRLEALANGVEAAVNATEKARASRTFH